MTSQPARKHHILHCGLLGLGLVLVLQACTVSSTSPSTTAHDDRHYLTAQEKNRLGQSVVVRLRERYRDTRSECPPDGKAAFYCNGVFARAMVSDWASPTFWNPVDKDIQRNGVSFIYMREDARIKATPGPAGIIMSEFAAHTQEKLVVGCAFPINAQTDARDDSCYAPGRPKMSCQKLRVWDLKSWLAYYEYALDFVCPFDPTARWFQLSIEIRRDYADIRGSWNEVIIRPWAQDIPERLPLEALWYNGSEEGLMKARTMQDHFIAATGLFIPIVRIETSHPDVFFYVPRDQSGLPTKAASIRESAYEPSNQASSRSR